MNDTSREAFEKVISILLYISSIYNYLERYYYLEKYTTEQFKGQYVDGRVQKAWVEFQAAQAEQAELIERQAVIIEDQLQTIESLNAALGGEGSLTTDNLVTIGRLETTIEEQAKLIAELVELLSVAEAKLLESAQPFDDAAMAIKQALAKARGEK